MSVGDQLGVAVQPWESTRPLAVGNSDRVTGLNICVVGGGFVGLVAAAGFAQFGHQVVCVEKDQARLKLLQTGKVPFFEKDLEGLLKRNIDADRLSFSSDLAEAVKGQQAIFLAVGTPSLESGRTDLSALEEVVGMLSKVAEDSQVVVLKSTVPVGTGKHLQAMFPQNGNGHKSIAVVNNPEFLREGAAVYDFFYPQRIVVGGEDPVAVELVANIYRVGMIRSVPILTTNNETAEMIKYASNAFLATKVGFINELAGLCDLVGIDVMEIAHGMGMDPRIGAEFLHPGPGWGGSCFRKDLMEFSGLARAQDYQLIIADAVLKANLRQHDLVVAKIARVVDSLDGARIGVLGLSFKAGTSDMRDSPAVPIIRQLLDEGAHVSAYDPQAHSEARQHLPTIELCDSAVDVAKDADCLVILTEWEEFQTLDLGAIAQMMRHPNLVDARNLLTPEVVRRYGLTYDGMGQR